ncbi:MAG: hypothetical protein QM656_11620 [Paracoccaceae bacterium]
MRKGLIGLALAAGAAAGLAFAALSPHAPPALPPAELAARLAEPLPPPAGPMRVFHLGHSLVGREMPAMLAAMRPGHVSHSQLGWGASLAQHWTGKVPGFAAENAHPDFRPAGAALASGDYDAVILTEMVELRDAIRWHDSADHLARWSERARQGRPDVRLYLYETWHRRDDPAGWAARIATDRPALWEAALLAPAMARPATGKIHVIPAGQVLAAAAAAIDAGRVPGMSAGDALFSDDIHLSAAGLWLVALTHHAVLYHRLPDPGGLPLPPGAETALRGIVWQTVLADPATGIPETAR